MGIVKAVDGRNPVIEQIDQCRRDQALATVTKLRDRGSHRGVLDHRPVIAIAHQRHIAVAVARALIDREQPELLDRGAGADEFAAQVLIGVADAPGGPGMGKALDGDPHRDAGAAAAARGPVGEAVAAPKPGTRKIVVEKGAVTAGEIDDQLALEAARDIGAGDRRNGKELARRPQPPTLRINPHVGLEGFAGRPAFSLRPDVHHTFLRPLPIDRRRKYGREDVGAPVQAPPSSEASRVRCVALE